MSEPTCRSPSLALPPRPARQRSTPGWARRKRRAARRERAAARPGSLPVVRMPRRFRHQADTAAIGLAFLDDDQQLAHRLAPGSPPAFVALVTDPAALLPRAPDTTLAWPPSPWARPRPPARTPRRATTLAGRHRAGNARRPPARRRRGSLRGAGGDSQASPGGREPRRASVRARGAGTDGDAPGCDVIQRL